MANSGPDLDQHDLEALSALSNYVRWIVSRFAPYIRGRVVEYGAGLGSISKHIVPLAEAIDFVEPSEILFPKLSRDFAQVPNTRCVNASLSGHAMASAAGSYDSVVLVNVLEHIKDDVAALRDVHRILAAEGTLCLMVPALPSLMSEYDVQMGHHRRYLMRELNELVAAAGFKIEKASYMDTLGVIPWWLFMRVLKRQHIRGWMARIFDLIVVPFGRALEALWRPSFGKNIILVARKIRT